MEGENNYGKMINISRSKPVILQPAKATPTTNYFLSNLDQNIPILIKFIYCFPPTALRISNSDVVHVLRTSLQKVLVHYYPLVGRLAIAEDGKLFVRFNGDNGVPFVEATADCELEKLGGDISVPEPVKLRDLVYCPQSTQSILKTPLLAVQVTKFRCGGLSLGLVMNHSIVDAVSIVEFRQALAETTRGLPLSLPPFLDRSILRASQPPDPKFHHQEYADLAPYISEPKFTNSDSIPFIRRFVFDSAKLSRLKQLAASANGERPSTFASLAGFIWLARTKVLNIPSVEPTKLLFPVDVRNRLEPPLPPGFFGNGVVFACCLCPAGLLMNRPLNHAVQMVQEAYRGITNRFIRSSIDCYELTRARPSLSGTFMITSWTRFGVESIDFGWGAAAQVGQVEIFTSELASFRPYGKDGKSISVILALPKQAMDVFEEIIDF